MTKFEWLQNKAVLSWETKSLWGSKIDDMNHGS